MDLEELIFIEETERQMEENRKKNDNNYNNY